MRPTVSRPDAFVPCPTLPSPSPSLPLPSHLLPCLPLPPLLLSHSTSPLCSSFLSLLFLVSLSSFLLFIFHIISPSWSSLPLTPVPLHLFLCDIRFLSSSPFPLPPSPTLLFSFLFFLFHFHSPSSLAHLFLSHSYSSPLSPLCSVTFSSPLPPPLLFLFFFSTYALHF